MIMRSKESIIIGALLMLVTYTLALSLVGQAFPQASSSKTLSSSGTIETIGVSAYSDAAGSNHLTSIPWGTLAPGVSKNFTCYIRNDGNSPSTLSMYPSSWNPSNASNYLTLSWDYGGQSINPGSLVAVTFTLSVSASIEGITSFSFDITIAGTS
jgi:hypothetical protein